MPSELATQIHPSAVIDASAQLGVGVEIGPYCIIGPHVELGDGCKLSHHVSIEGPCKIGARNEFFPFACIGQRTQDLKYAGEPTSLEIGQENVFREFVTVHRSDSEQTVTRIGNFNHFLAYAHIAHDCEVGNWVIFSNNGTLAGHVVVEDYAIIGGLSAVHQFCRVGAHSIIGGCAKIVQDVPPYCIVDGNPSKVRGLNKVGLQRREFPETEIKALRTCYRELYRTKQAWSELFEPLSTRFAESPAVGHWLKFIQASERGVIR